MTYKELFSKLTPEQLEQQIAVFIGDEENARLDIEINISDQDEYFDHGDAYGTLDQIKADYPDDWEDIVSDCVVVPAGCVTLCIND